MVKLRRWLKLKPAQLFIAGTVLVGGLSGCQSIRNQAAVDSTSPGDVPAHTPPPIAIPYEESLDSAQRPQVPLPEAVTDTAGVPGEPDPVPALDVSASKAVETPVSVENESAAADQSVAIDETTDEPVVADESVIVEEAASPETNDDAAVGESSDTEPVDVFAAPDDDEADDPITSSPVATSDPATTPVETSDAPTVTDETIEVTTDDATILDEIDEPEESAVPVPDSADAVESTDDLQTSDSTEVSSDVQESEAVDEVLQADPESDVEASLSIDPPALRKDPPSRLELADAEIGKAIEASARSGKIDVPALPEIDRTSVRPSVASVRKKTTSIFPPNLPSPEIAGRPSIRNANDAGFVDSPELIASLNLFGSDLVLDGMGHAFVSHGESISRIGPDRKVAAWSNIGSPQGHVILQDGSHVVCDARTRSLQQLDASGNLVQTLAVSSDGDFLRAPNDLAVDEYGGIYFSDPGYARIRNAIGKVHYISQDRMIHVVVEKLAFPEGIALSPGGSNLFVVESQKNRILQFELLSAGRIGSRRVFVTLPEQTIDGQTAFPDDLVVDHDGRLFVTHHGTDAVTVVTSEGDIQESLIIPEGSVGGVAFQPGDAHQLYVTGGTAGEDGHGSLFRFDRPRR